MPRNPIRTPRTRVRRPVRRSRSRAINNVTDPVSETPLVGQAMSSPEFMNIIEPSLERYVEAELDNQLSSNDFIRLVTDLYNLPNSNASERLNRLSEILDNDNPEVPLFPRDLQDRINRDMDIVNGEMEAPIRPPLSEEIADQIEEFNEDIEAPEPISGSPFQRRGMVECILDDVENLTQHRLYRIEELGEDDNTFLIQDDTRENNFYPSSLFRPIDHGPFRVKDIVRILDVQGVRCGDTLISTDYVSNTYMVVEVTDTTVTVQLNSSRTAVFNNSQVNMHKRNVFLPPNPFKRGDQVKVVKTKSYNVSLGDIYTIRDTDGDYVVIVENPLRNYPHTLFVKHVRKEKKKRPAPKLSLREQIRHIINTNCYEKVDDNMILTCLKNNKDNREDLCLQDVKKYTKEMFSW